MELKVVRDLIDKLNSNKINYCHWKSNQHVSEAFTGIDDIDMLIAQEDILKLNIILNEIGYKRFRLPEKRAYIGIEDYLGLDLDTGNIVHLHLHYQLTLGEKFLKGYQLPYSKSILNRRTFDSENSIYITSSEDEMWLLLLRLALKIRHRDYIKFIFRRDIFGSSTMKEFKWLQQRIDLELFKKIAKNYLGDTISNQMSKMIKEGIEFKTILILRNNIKKVCAPFKSFSVISGTFTRWSREYFRITQLFHNKIHKRLKIYRRAPISGGKLVAFLGPDGAGKSTVIKEVNKTLGRVIDVNELYLGSGDGQSSLLRKPLKFIYSFLLKKGIMDRKSKKVDKSGKTKRVGEHKNASIIRSIGQLPWIYTLARERKNKLIKASKFRSKGYVVITDRYPQTQVINVCDGPRYYLNESIPKEKFTNKLLASYEEKSFRIAEQLKPDLVIILKVSSEIAYERKPEEIDTKSHRYLMNTILGIDFGEDTKKVIIDANQPFDKVIVDALSAIWKCL